MTVLILERVSPSLRGELTRWLLELKAGVFVGHLSGMVRDRLWELACKEACLGAGILVHTTDTEQGFAFRFHGEPGREVVDFEGLALLRARSS